MRTQGISLLISANEAAATVKSTKVSDETFDSFMSNQAAKVSVNDMKKDTVPANKKEDCSVNRDIDSHSLDLKTTGQKEMESNPTTNKELEHVDVSEMVEQTKMIVKKIFGLSEEELTDLMEQLGVNIQDLLFQTQDGLVVLLNVEALQKFVLEVHGVEDAAVFLTNDVMEQELSQLTDELTNVLAEGLGVEPEEVADLQNKVMLDFAEQMQQAEVGTGEEMSAQLPKDETLEGDTTEKISVIVETQQESTSADEGKSSSDYSDGGMTQTTDELPKTTVVNDNQMTSAFTDNLTQALEKVNHIEELAENRTMVQIVEQVVRQVRIRVMPETTSMEMQLNPANLGRVHLTVATTGGIATATMVVENQMAKNALESQMITLKETFAEQGLKVEDVEVTVAEFGLKKENQQQQETSDERKQNRRLRAEEDLPEDEEGVADANITATERRDANSMVDYTA